MRKYLPFFVFTILLCTSCARDNLYKDALMGTWKLQQMKQNEEWEYCELQFTLNNETIYTKFKCNKK